MKSILVSQGYSDHLGGTVTERFEKDISGTRFTVALVRAGAPVPDADSPSWVTPDVDEAGDNVWERNVELVVDTLPAGGPGDYDLLVNIDDDPDRVPMVLDRARLS
jgi:hypothetical protein